MKIALLSSFNADLLPSWLVKFLQEDQIQAHFYVSGYDQYRQELLNPASDLYRFRPEVILLLLDSQDVLADLIQQPFDYTKHECQVRIESELSNIRQYIQLVHTHLPGAILFLNTLAAPPVTSLGLLEHNSAYSVRGMIARYNMGVVELAQQVARTYIVDCEALAAESGWWGWIDERMWVLGRMRLGRGALEALARRYKSAIRAAHGLAKKVLVLDADNTLWGGLIGTEGVEGIQLGHEGVGLTYRQFQAEILNLYKRGVVLALISKNDADDVNEVFSNHPAMLLKREHFAAFYVNWQDKATNLRQIAEQLNLGLDAFVFVDDSAFECAWVSTQLPEVLVLHLPPDPVEFVHALRNLDAFATFTLTNEDLIRGQQYHQELQRKELQQTAHSIEEFYLSLAMRAVIRPLASAMLPRVAQLIQKTNQFNLTGHRYSAAEIRALAEQHNCKIYTLSLNDRFGDNGLVGVAILIWEAEICRIDVLLLSCRVMGRTVETAFLAFLAERAQAYGARYLAGEFIPTAKNMPVRDFYQQQGFMPHNEDGRWWRYDLLTGHLHAPHYIELDLPEEVINAQSSTH